MRVTAIMNLKGGTAKTVSAINAAAVLAKYHGMATLLIDADSQGNLSEFVAEDPKMIGRSVGTADLLKGGHRLDLLPTKIPGAMLVPGNEDLMDLDITAAKNGNADPMALADLFGNFFSVKGSCLSKFDHCFIDCPPAFNAAAIAALTAADDVVIPVKLDAFGIRGLSRLLKQIKAMQQINPDLEIAGVLPTMFYSCPEQKQAEADLREALHALGIRCFHHIRRSKKVDSSTFEQMPLPYYSPKSCACTDYRIFIRELVGEEEK